MNITHASIAALLTGFRGNFDQGLQAAESQYERVATVVPSSTKSNTYGWLGKSAVFRKWAGDRVIQNLKTHAYTIENESYENTISVGRDEIDDDSYGVYAPLFEMMGQTTKTHPDDLVFDLLLQGFSKTCYDGQYFFDTDHIGWDASGNEISVSNMQAGAGTPWFLLDVSKPLKPMIFQKRREYDFQAMDKPDDPNVFHKKEFIYGVDARVNAGFGLWQLAFGSKADLTTDNYVAARAAMQGIRMENGKPLKVMPRLLLVPPSLEKKALDVVKAERDAAGATNTMANTAEVLVCPWIGA